MESNEKLLNSGGYRLSGTVKYIQQDDPFLISVITVSYNAAKHIERAIRSVEIQNYSRIEHIIIDGGSTDDTRSILSRYNHVIAYWRSEQDAGIYDAMNKSISYCEGEFILFLNSDDFFIDKDVIRKAVCELEKSGASALCGGINFIDGEENFLYKVKTKKGDKFSYLMHQAFLYKKVLHKKYGFYDTTYKINADYDFYLKLLNSNCNLAYSELIFSNMQVGGATNQHAYLSASETLHIHLKNNLPVKKAIMLFIIKIIKISLRTFVVSIRLNFVVVPFLRIIKRWKN